ncbi:hypothetical protein Agub_g6337, partial [Astrephomene gubernaculifera]
MVGLQVVVSALLLVAYHAAAASSGPILTDFNCRKIAFYKTHKTGSTTVGGIMFRAAVHANMSIYTTKSHYVTVGYRETAHLMGKTDMVLRHIRYSAASNWHLATRSFYSRALGTSDYGFLTVLRNPVDRYVSDFYYFVEPEARAAGRPLTLSAHVEAGAGANRMAGEFGLLQQQRGSGSGGRGGEGGGEQQVLEFAAGEMHTDGLYLPVELLDYGLALLGARCGWALEQLLYLPVNSNTAGAERYGNVKLAARPNMEELAAQEPELLTRIARLNSLDAVLYGAAQGLMLGRLAVGGAAAAAGVMGAAVRLTAARKRLEAECRTLTSRWRLNNSTEGTAAAAGRTAALASEEVQLAGVCSWYSLVDSVYEKLPNDKTGYVTPETLVPYGAVGLSAAPPSWPVVGEVLRAAQRHLAVAADPSVSYYHTLVAVRVRPPTPAEAEELYGISGGGAGNGGGGDAAEDAVLAAAVRVWTQHHAAEGADHLVFCVDGGGDMTSGVRVEVVRQSAAAALAGSSLTGYTTFEVTACDGGDHDAGGGGGESGGSGLESSSTLLGDLVSRSRWSTELPGLSYFLHGNRGTVRSVLLSYEVAVPAAGGICAPTVPWRVESEGSGEGRQRRRRRLVAAEQGTDEDLEGGEEDGGASSDEGDDSSSRQPSECIRLPCTPGVTGSQPALPCTILRSLPLLGLKRTFSSNGRTELPYGKTKVPYKLSSSSPSSYNGFEEYRLQVSQLLPASGADEQQQQRAEQPGDDVGDDEGEGGGNAGSRDEERG